MDKLTRLILALCAFCVIASCMTTSSVESNKDPSFSGPIDKLFVIVDVGDHPTQGGKLGDVIAGDVQNALRQKGIDCKAVRITGLELSADNYKKQMADFGAKQIMAITLTQGAISTSNTLLEIGNNNQLTKAIFDASILDASDNSLLWRAKIKVEGGTSWSSWTQGGPIDPAKVSEGIISALQKDALLPKNPAQSL